MKSEEETSVLLYPEMPGAVAGVQELHRCLRLAGTITIRPEFTRAVTADFMRGFPEMPLQSNWFKSCGNGMTCHPIS